MRSCRTWIEDAVTPAQALARGVALWETTRADAPVALYGATLRGDALVLGAHQRAADALTPAAREQSTVLRRATGGITVQASEGVVYVALGLHERSVLMSCPKLRILNRNVRGALAGLRLAGAAAHYFGRDFLTVDTRPAAFVGWDARADGRVLLEFFIAERASYLPASAAIGYPARLDDPLRGKTVITLAETCVTARGRTLVEKLAEGYAAGYALELGAADPISCHELPELAASTADTDDAALAWSTPREEAIGFVSAGAALDSSGKLRALRLAGDFFQDRMCPAALERVLLGTTPSAEQVGRALDDVLARGERELEGVRDLGSLREVILDAVALAQRGEPAR